MHNRTNSPQPPTNRQMRWRKRAVQLKTMRREQKNVGSEPRALQALKVGAAPSSRLNVLLRTTERAFNSSPPQPLEKSTRLKRCNVQQRKHGRARPQVRARLPPNRQNPG
jgi:hypothetical protein